MRLSDDINNISPCQRENVEQSLWQEYSRNGSQEIKNTLVELYTPYVKSLATRIFLNKKYLDIEFVDYMQFGYIGLLEAIDRYDPTIGVKFTTFSNKRIKGAIFIGISKQTERCAQAVYKKQLRHERIQSSYNESSNDLFQDIINVTISLALGYLLEYSVITPENYGKKYQKPLDNSEFGQFKSKLYDIVDNLPDSENAVVTYHYYHQICFEEIGEILQLSKGRVSQLHKTALERVRLELKKQNMLDKLI